MQQKGDRMNNRFVGGLIRFMFGIVLVSCVSTAQGQSLPWDTFEDPAGSICDVVNAANAELVVLRSTGQLTIVTGLDVTLQDTIVDENGDVFFEGESFGFLSFEEDGDGTRTLWWVSLTGNVLDVDQITGEPFPTNMLPTDFVDVPCDACPLWDVPEVCDEPVAPPPDIVLPPITVNLCGSDLTIGMIMSFSGLMMLGFTSRRRW